MRPGPGPGRTLLHFDPPEGPDRTRWVPRSLLGPASAPPPFAAESGLSDQLLFEAGTLGMLPWFTRLMEESKTGILLMVAATVAIAALDGLRKGLSSEVSLSLIIAVRYLAFLVLICFWRRSWRGLSVLRTRHPYLQAMRSVIMFAETVTFVVALTHATLADSNAVFALSPVIGVVFARLFLAERVEWTTWFAVGLSLAGVVLILRPSGESTVFGLMFALVSAVLFASYGTLTRRVSDTDTPQTSFAYMTLIGALLSGAFIGVQTPSLTDVTPGDGTMLLLAAVAAAAGQIFLIQAYSRATAQSLQPYNYLLVVWSALISAFLFTAPPSAETLIGAALIIIPNILVMTRPKKLAHGCAQFAGKFTVRRHLWRP